MASFTIRFPTREEEERERSFTVIKNYVSSIAAYLFDDYGPPNQLTSRLVCVQRNLSGYRKIERRPFDRQLIARFLRIAWASELQLRLGALGERTVLRYTNAWAPVHSYYGVYMSLQAWFAANGMTDLVDDHSSSLRTIANMIASRQLFPLPWSVACSGCPHLDEVSFERLPPGADPNVRFEVLSRPTPELFWPRFCKMLETTRKQRLERNFFEWKRSQRRKIIRSEEKRRVSENLLPTTLFDFFWRLRIRSNYRDVSSYLTWNVSDLEHQEFMESLTTVTDATCTLVQSLLVPAISRRAYGDLIEEFLESTRSGVPGAVTFLEERRAALL